MCHAPLGHCWSWLYTTSFHKQCLSLTIFPCSCFAIHLYSLTKNVTNCFPQSLLSSLCFVSVNLSKPPFFIVWYRNFIYLFLILSKSILLIHIFLETSSLVACSIYGILSMIVQQKWWKFMTYVTIIPVCYHCIALHYKKKHLSFYADDTL